MADWGSLFRLRERSFVFALTIPPGTEQFLALVFYFSFLHPYEDESTKKFVQGRGGGSDLSLRESWNRLKD